MSRALSAVSESVGLFLRREMVRRFFCPGRRNGREGIYEIRTRKALKSLGRERRKKKNFFDIS